MGYYLCFNWSSPTAPTFVMFCIGRTFEGLEVANIWYAPPRTPTAPFFRHWTCHLCHSLLFSGDNKCRWHVHTNPKWTSPKRATGLSPAKAVVFIYGKRTLKLSASSPPPPVTGTRGFFVPGGRLFGKLKSRHLDLAGLMSAIRVCASQSLILTWEWAKNNLVTLSAVCSSEVVVIELRWEMKM